MARPKVEESTKRATCHFYQKQRKKLQALEAESGQTKSWIIRYLIGKAKADEIPKKEPA